MATNKSTSNLVINVLSKEQLATQSSLDDSQIYVVTQNTSDTEGNVVSSKTYADVGRDAVLTQTTEPTSQYTQIWINPNEDVVYISPADADMNNITETGSANITAALAPNFSNGTSYSQAEGQLFTVTSTGWLYVIIGASSAIELKKDNSTGIDLVGCVTTVNNKETNHILLEKNTTVYVNRRSGTVILNFFPCKGFV